MWDGLSRIDDLVKRAAKLDQPALAMTDHGNISGTPDFYKACRDEKISPIIGQEFYIIGDATEKDKNKKYAHMLILAKDTKGYQTLAQLSSIASTPEHFYYKPRIDWKILEQFRPELKHLIATTGCMNGYVPRNLMAGKEEVAAKYLKRLRDLFPSLYAEIMFHPHEEETDWNRQQQNLNEKVIELANLYSVPILITNDSHYTTEQQQEIHQLILNTKKKDEYKNVDIFPGTGYHLKSEEEMEMMWDEDVWEASQESIKEIYSGVQDFSIPLLEKKRWYIPIFPRKDADEVSSAKLIFRICKRRLRELDLYNDTYLGRLRYEMGVIKSANFEEEFLLVRDYIRWANRNNILVGAGRGSMAGVLVAYLLGITGVDPIRYNLLFERALNPARPSLPDFDVDFQASRRDEVVEYLFQKYGHDNTMQVCTFGTMAPRGAVGAVLRALQVPFQDAIAATKGLPDVVEIIGERKKAELKELLEDEEFLKRDVPKLLELMEQYPQIKPWSIGIQGIIKNVGTHAAGVIISDGQMDIRKYVPTQLIPSNGRTVSQFDMGGVKQLGFVKFDILGLNTLDTISNAISEIGYDPFEDLKDMEDPETFEMMNEGRLATIFQMQGPACRVCVSTMGIKSFEDIVAINALSRPGAIKFLDAYHQQRDHPKKVQYIHPKLEEILGTSNGVLLYQEQTMHIGLDIAGMDHYQIDDLKEAIKYKKSAVFKKLKPVFFDSAKQQGVKKEVVDGLWDMIRDASGYQFNRAHAVSYAILGFQTAYLMRHFPVEWFKAVLITTDTKAAESKGKLNEVMQEARKSGIKFRPPDINLSEATFSIERSESKDQNYIRFGLSQIKGVGEKAAQALVERRGEGYRDVDDVRKAAIRPINKRTLDVLERSGALESIGIPGDPDKRERQVEYLGVTIKSSIRREWAHRIRQFWQASEDSLRGSTDDIVKLGGEVTRVKVGTTKLKEDGSGGRAYCFARLDFEGQSVELVCWPEQYAIMKKEFVKGAVILVKGKRQASRGTIIVKAIKRLG